VALDLRLFVRAQASRALGELTAFVDELLGRVTGEEATMVPAYTHRQRAQPVSVAFLMCAWSAQLLRAGRALRAAVDGANECPLGSGACSGTSLPIDRTIVAELLRFPRITHNALDTVGDRDFALDFAWAGARVLLALGKVAADLVDFSTAEFGLVKLDGRVATGSSMMPQKKNPDIFELVRGKSSRGIGNVVALLTLVKGLPSGYNRDQQEDRGALLGTAPLVRGTIDAMRRALPHAAFVGERGHSFVAEGFTQATDLAEALVRQGMPFREAYKAVGALVRHATTERIPLVEVDGQNARAVNPAFSDEVLAVLDPKKAMDAKRSAGGTSAESVGEQREALRAEAMHLRAYAESIPDTATLVASLAAAPLERPLNA
jgi:argininosuccinate lyase